MNFVQPTAVSVILPAYDVTAYIRTALDSVLAQTRPASEIIVVNDGCPDTENLERSLASYRPHIRYIKQENGGVGAARRTAVEAARSPFIAQLDPDDRWEPEYLEVQMRLMEANPLLDMIYANGRYFGNRATEGKLLMDHAPSVGDVTFLSAVRGDVNILYSALIRKSAIEAAGSFDPEFRTSEDFHLWLRMLHGGARIAYHREPLLHYRQRADSLTASATQIANWALRALDDVEASLPLTEGEKSAMEERRAKVRMEQELSRGKEAIGQRDWGGARWHLAMYQRYSPNRKLTVVLFLLRFFPWAILAAMSARDRLFSKGLIKAKAPVSS